MVVEHLTVDALAEAKGIPVEELRGWQVLPASNGATISYGPDHRDRLRTTVRAGDGSRWAGTRKPIGVYGLHTDQVARGREQGQLLVVEGESDCWTAWHHGLAAVGVPGATQTTLLRPEQVAGIEKVLVVREPDAAGSQFAAGVRARFADFEAQGFEVPELYELVLPGVKDLNDLHLRHIKDTEAFRSELDSAIVAAPRIWPPDDALVALSASFSDGRGPWPVLSRDALHGLAGDVVETWEPHTEGDASALLFEVLAGFGNLVGNDPYLIGGQKHWARLFPLIIGATSKGRKGTANYNIMALLRDVDPDWANHGVIGGTASGEGIIRAADDRNGSPMQVIESEFSRVLKVASRDGSIVSEVIRQAWDDTTLHNATAKDPIHVHNAHVTMVGHSTAQELLRRMDNVDIFNGFANRFLLVAAQRSKKLPFGGELPLDEHERLVRKLKEAATQARAVREMKRTHAAKKLWAEWYLALPDDEPGLVGAVTARAEAQVLRLQMAYALLDGTDTINVNHVRAAIAAWDYCVQTARWLFGDRLGDPDAEKLIEALLDAPSGMDARQIMALYGRHRTAEQVSAIKERADRWLRRHGTYLDEEQEPTGGRPRTITGLAPLDGEGSEQSEQSSRRDQEPGA